MRNRTSVLRIPRSDALATEPQRLHCERGLFHFLQRSVLAKYWLMLRHSVYMSMGSKSRVLVEPTCMLSAFIRECFVTSISDWPIEWYNSAPGFSHDKGDLNWNKRYQGKTKVHLCLMLDPSARLDYRTLSSWTCYSTLNRPLHLNTNLASNNVLILFQTSPSNRTVATLESALRVERTFFFVRGGAIIDQRSLLVGHIFI